MRRVPPLAIAAILVILAWSAPVSSAGLGPDQKQQPPSNSGNRPPGPALLKPDLTPTKVWFATWVENPTVQPLVMIRTALKKGVKVWMVCDLVNRGIVDSKGFWQLGYYVDGTEVCNNSWGDLGAGKPLRGLCPYTPDKEGTHALKCLLDETKKIVESNETNNIKEILFTVVN